jgi:hypothetical protein
LLVKNDFVLKTGVDIGHAWSKGYGSVELIVYAMNFGVVSNTIVLRDIEDARRVLNIIIKICSNNR